METLPEKRLPVIPLTAPALCVQPIMVLEGISAENSAAHHEARLHEDKAERDVLLEGYLQRSEPLWQVLAQEVVQGDVDDLVSEA